MSKTVISALPTLQPTRVVDVSSGEILGKEEWKTSINSLLEWVQSETVRLFEGNKTQVLDQAAVLKGSANSYARQRGYRSNAMSLNREIKAKSRLNELVLFKLMSEAAAYSRNSNPRKKPHKFNRTVNLGAVDKQMVLLERLGDVLILTWKCWDKELEFTFKIPAYALKREITKISLPIVSAKGFIFTIQEQPIAQTGNNIAGVDLGRKEPFTLAVLNTNNNLVANYFSRPQIKQTNFKRERLLQEVKYLQAKIRTYEKLGLPAETLITEKRRTKNKAARIGVVLVKQTAADITQKTIRHEVKILHLEDLRWATGAKYGSRWVHGQTSEKLEHTAARNGLKTKRVNPKNTSQTCHQCGNKITHNTKTRVVKCGDCQKSFDRDFNAAMNIARNKNSGPVHVYRRNGDESQASENMFASHSINHMVTAVDMVDTT